MADLGEPEIVENVYVWSGVGKVFKDLVGPTDVPFIPKRNVGTIATRWTDRKGQ